MPPSPQEAMNTHLEPVHRQIGAVASGTISVMTGLRRWDDIEELRDDWQRWAMENPGHAKTWQESWLEYKAWLEMLPTLKFFWGNNLNPPATRTTQSSNAAA